MARRTIIPVILSGGSGTRLWPLSTAERPKQFHPLVTERSLFQDTIARAGALQDVQQPLVVCNEAHAGLVQSDLAALGVQALAVLLEPSGRNTAPAIAAAAVIAEQAFPDAFLLVLAADHAIENQAAFASAVDTAAAVAGQNYLVTFGIVPDRPETGYGYIRKGEPHGAWAQLSRFVEKPDLEMAEHYVASGEYLWNSGMFMMPAKLYLAELQAHQPEMFAAVTAAVTGSSELHGCLRLGDAFSTCPADSIDYAVMEKTRRAAVVPLDAGWSDVGSWSALRETQRQDERGNVFHGDVVASTVNRSFVHASGKRVVVAGLDNVVIVETPDTILVMAESESQNVKALRAQSERKRDSDE
jgi:mannose-1-phosphate guanylyltransferase/mannose-6-phosphate isomerase